MIVRVSHISCPLSTHIWRKVWIATKPTGVAVARIPEYLGCLLRWQNVVIITSFMGNARHIWEGQASVVTRRVVVEKAADQQSLASSKTP